RDSYALGAETGEMRPRSPEVGVAEFEGRKPVELISAEDFHPGIRVAARVGRRYTVACAAEIGLAEPDAKVRTEALREHRCRKRKKGDKRSGEQNLRIRAHGFPLVRKVGRGYSIAGLAKVTVCNTQNGLRPQARNAVGY